MLIHLGQFNILTIERLIKYNIVVKINTEYEARKVFRY